MPISDEGFPEFPPEVYEIEGCDVQATYTEEAGIHVHVVSGEPTDAQLEALLERMNTHLKKYG